MLEGTMKGRYLFIFSLKLGLELSTTATIGNVDILIEIFNLNAGTAEKSTANL